MRCRNLTAHDLDHIGEYLMFKALGSTSLHQAMNDRMVAMLGERGESRMHQLLGARYAGCTTTSTGGYGGMMGAGGMMGGYYNTNCSAPPPTPPAVMAGACSRSWQPSSEGSYS